MQRLFLNYAIIFSRFLIMIVLVFISKKPESSFFQLDITGVIAMLLFAITNGLTTTSLMELGPKKTKSPPIINLINFIGGFSITFGISIGTVIALIIKEVD